MNIILARPAGPGFEIAIETDAVATRDALLERVVFFGAVDTADQLAEAAGHVQALKAHIRDTESARQAVKKPVLDAGIAIDVAARNHVAPLLAEVDRIDLLQREYRTTEAQRVARENARIREEQERADRIKREHEAEAERARVAAENEARWAKQRAELAIIEAEKANNADAVAEAQKAKAAAEAAEQLRVAEQAKAAEAKRQADLEHSARLQQIAPPSAAVAVKGQVVKPVVRFEVTDAPLLYRSNPDCFDLKERRSVIQANITAGRFTIPTCPPGLRMWEEIEVRTTAPRRKAEGLTLDV